MWITLFEWIHHCLGTRANGELHLLPSSLKDKFAAWGWCANINALPVTFQTRANSSLASRSLRLSAKGVACETGPPVCQHTQHGSKERQFWESDKTWITKLDILQYCYLRAIKFPGGNDTLYSVFSKLNYHCCNDICNSPMHRTHNFQSFRLGCRHNPTGYLGSQTSLASKERLSCRVQMRVWPTRLD